MGFETRYEVDTFSCHHSLNEKNCSPFLLTNFDFYPRRILERKQSQKTAEKAMKFYFNFSFIILAIETVAYTYSPTVSPAPSVEVDVSNGDRPSRQKGFQSPFSIGSTVKTHNSVNGYKVQGESTALNANGNRVVAKKAISTNKTSRSPTVSPAPTASAKSLNAEGSHEKERLLGDSSTTPTTSPAPANVGRNTPKVLASSKSSLSTPPSEGGNINLEVEHGQELFDPYQENSKDGVKYQRQKSNKQPSVSAAPVLRKGTARKLSTMSKPPTTSPAPTCQHMV